MKKIDKIADSITLWGTPVIFAVAHTVFKYLFPHFVNANKSFGIYLACFIVFICGLVTDIVIKRKGLTIREIIDRKIGSLH